MSDERVIFYFAYNSPFAFLANTRIDEALAPLGVPLDRKPVYQPSTGGGPDFNSPRIQYMFQDIARFAKAYGLKLNPGPFADTGRACLGFLFASEAGTGKEFHDRVYRARWLEGLDIGDEATLMELAEASALDRDKFLAAIDDDSPYAEARADHAAAAEADGVFGFPFFVYKDQKFWGNDRIEWLVKVIEEDRAK